jgi:hypothetical protein
MIRKELAMTHTKWLDHCCRALEQEQEWPSDVQAVGLVRARCIAQKIGERFSYDDLGRVQQQGDALIEMALNSFKEELSQLATTPAFSSEPSNGIISIENIHGAG